ncbi:MAG TPA: serine/threonine protein kinase [Candidatus Kapabacteria bacterium]|nr:serine/threonine protein kinase [Candidatus Kapabacteria bacterium]
MTYDTREPLATFGDLTPDIVIDVTERALGRRMTNLCRALNSYINRVFELQAEDGTWVIAKFYRPGRWSAEALQDEHDFLTELAEHELPVIPPLELSQGHTLGRHRGMYFALFPKKLGRACDEPSMEEWEALGRLIAQMHNIGERHGVRDRITIAPRRSTEANIAAILRANVLPRDMRTEYERVAHELVELIAPMFEGAEMIRVHGDLHRANIVYRPGESFFLIDFDDMAIGPPVHDLWMLLPDYGRKSLLEIDLFLEGYTTFRSFKRSALKLIEPLRAMRYIYFTSWCAMQVADGGFARVAPGFGTSTYWRGEINDLRKQYEEIILSREAFWGFGA